MEYTTTYRANSKLLTEQWKDQIQSETNDYLIVTFTERINCCNKIDDVYIVGIHLLGYINLNTGERIEETASLLWAIDEDEQCKGEYKNLFQDLTVYHVRCRPIDSSFTVNHHRNLILTEIVHSDKNDAWLEALIQKNTDRLHLHSDLFGIMKRVADYPAYRGKFNWLGSECEVIVSEEFKPVTVPLQYMEKLCHEHEYHDSVFRKYVAENLLEEINEQMQSNFSKEELTTDLRMKSITMYYTGSFEVYYAFHTCVISIESNINDPHKSFITYIEEYRPHDYYWSLS